MISAAVARWLSYMCCWESAPTVPEHPGLGILITWADICVLWWHKACTAGFEGRFQVWLFSYKVTDWNRLDVSVTWLHPGGIGKALEQPWNNTEQHRKCSRTVKLTEKSSFSKAPGHSLHLHERLNSIKLLLFFTKSICFIHFNDFWTTSYAVRWPTAALWCQMHFIFSCEHKLHLSCWFSDFILWPAVITGKNEISCILVILELILHYSCRHCNTAAYAYICTFIWMWQSAHVAFLTRFMFALQIRENNCKYLTPEDARHSLFVFYSLFILCLCHIMWVKMTQIEPHTCGGVRFICYPSFISPAHIKLGCAYDRGVTSGPCRTCMKPFLYFCNLL